MGQKMAQAVAEKRQVRDEEFGIHGDLAGQEGSDSFVVLFDSAEQKKDPTEPISPRLEDLDENQVITDKESQDTPLGNAYIDEILSSEDVEPVTPTAAAGHEEDDGPIALTNEELDGILEMGPKTDEEFHPDFPIENTSTAELAPPPLPLLPEEEASATAPTLDEDEELPIAISDEDLDEILLEEEGELSPAYPPARTNAQEAPVTPADDVNLLSHEQPQETASSENIGMPDADLVDEEPIALSDDELDHILADAEAGHSEAAPELMPKFEDEVLTLDKDPGLALTDDVSTTPEPTSEPQTPESTSGFFDSDEDEPITLSDEELDGILSTAPEEESIQSDEVALPNSSQQKSLPIEDDEPITLSADELDGILMDADEAAPIDMPSAEPEPASTEGKGFFDSDDDEPIALSADELDGIAATATTEEAVEAPVDLDSRYADVDQMPETDEAATAGTTDEDEGPIALSTDELDGIAADAREVTPEAPMVGLAPLDATPAEPSLAEQQDKPATVFEEDLEAATLIHEDEAKSAAQSTNVPDTEELKSVMSYLDNLLGELPDDVIEKFAQSEYFKLYQKIMDKLGL